MTQHTWGVCLVLWGQDLDNIYYIWKDDEGQHSTFIRQSDGSEREYIAWDL